MSNVLRWSPTLTDRQRVLLHTHPLILMRHNWLAREDENSYDPLCLAMKLFEVVIDQSGFGNDLTRDTLERELVPVLKSLDDAVGLEPNGERYARVIDRLLGGLLNDSQRGES